MIRTVDGSESQSNFHLPRRTCPHFCKSFYKIVSAVFRQLAMCFQYVGLFGCIFIRHCRCIPSALPRSKIEVFTPNIASLPMLIQSLKTVWHPIPKNQFQEIGTSAGLRVSHDIVYRPASGLCLGMAFTVLSEYFQSKEVDTKERLLASARVLERGGNETSVKVQALYEALIGVEGSIAYSDKVLFSKILKKENIQPSEIKGKEWVRGVKAFFSSSENRESLRQFVLNDLEKRGVEITADLYAPILELDAYWYRKQNPDAYNNDPLHDTIIQTVAKTLQMDIKSSMRIRGGIDKVVDELKSLDEGNYFIQFPQHTILLVKTEEGLALFNATEGMAWIEIKDQEEALVQLLGFYGQNDRVTVRILEVVSS